MVTAEIDHAVSEEEAIDSAILLALLVARRPLDLAQIATRARLWMGVTAPQRITSLERLEARRLIRRVTIAERSWISPLDEGPSVAGYETTEAYCQGVRP